MTRLAAALLCSLLCAPPLAAGVEMREVALYDGRVRLEVPAHWHEIAAETLEFYSLRSAEATGGRVAEIYQLGFRPGDPELDFALPQVLIQIRESGREPYGQFLSLPRADVIQKLSAERLAEHTGPLMTALELEEITFDRERFALTMTNALDLRLEGEALVTSVTFLTERGYLLLHCYAHASQMRQAGPIFAHIIDSIRFDDELAYQPKLIDRWPPHPSTIAFTAAGVTFLVLVAMVVIQRRRQT